MNNRLCRHIKSDNIHCGSPALSGAKFCYQHYRLLKRRRKLTAPAYLAPASMPEPDLYLDEITDPISMQIALSRVIREIAAGHIKNNRADAILRGLQLAANNLRRIERPVSRRRLT